MPYTVKTFSQTSEAANALSSARRTHYMAGGTLIMRAMNEGDQSFDTVIRSTDPTLSQIKQSAARIEIGAGATMAQVMASSELAFLHSAAHAVGGPAIRNIASVGGNLFARCPYGDFTAALLVLDATVSIAGGYSGHDMPLEEFLAVRNREPHQLVSAISIARPATSDAFRFLKFSRVKPARKSVLSIAAHLPQSGGRVSGARIAYCGMAETPIRVPVVERSLEGKSLDEASIAQACAVACEGTSPSTDPIASDWYRREVAPVYLKRLLMGQTSRRA